MPALNFTVFTEKILSGEKCQTIRPPRKNPIKPGDKLYLYTGMRTKNCRKLGEAVCSEVVPIDLMAYYKLLLIYPETQRNKTCRVAFRKPIKIDIAIADGFKSESGFDNFFINTYKLKPGDSKEFVIIKWRDFKPEPT